MTIFLNEHDVESLLTVPNHVDMLEKAMIDQGKKSTVNTPRRIVKTEKVGLSVLQAAVPAINRVGFKTYTTAPGGVRFWVMLFDGSQGSLDAIIEAEHIGLIRTAGASGVATKHLARKDARIGAVLGTGYQAGAQIEAICHARKLDRIYAWSRTPENVRKFADEQSKKLGVEVVPAASAQEAVADADVVVTITSSKTPILKGDWLKEGAHVNLVGAMKPTSREVDDRTLERAALLTVDDWNQAHLEAGEYIEATAAGVISWDDIKEISDVLAGTIPGRQSDKDITVFKSHGIGVWDVAAGQRVLELALEQNVGVKLPIEQAARQLGNGLDPSRLKP